MALTLEKVFGNPTTSIARETGSKTDETISHSSELENPDFQLKFRNFASPSELREKLLEIFRDENVSFENGTIFKTNIYYFKCWFIDCYHHANFLIHVYTDGENYVLEMKDQFREFGISNKFEPFFKLLMEQLGKLEDSTDFEITCKKSTVAVDGHRICQAPLILVKSLEESKMYSVTTLINFWMSSFATFGYTDVMSQQCVLNLELYSSEKENCSLILENEKWIQFLDKITDPPCLDNYQNMMARESAVRLIHNLVQKKSELVDTKFEARHHAWLEEEFAMEVLARIE